MLTIETPAASASKQSSDNSADARNFLLLAGACLLLFFAALGSWGFIDPGDGYFSEAAREMIEGGNYIVPHLNYQIYFSKPILIFWLIIGAYKVFGINEFAARFWSAALATAVVLVCYWTTRCVANKRAGLFAGLALATSPLVITFARMSLIDMGFSALLGIAVCATAMTLMTNSRRWWPVIYTALGLAVLDKGPAALVIYGLGAVTYLVASRPSLSDIRELFSRLHPFAGLLLLAAISVPWYIAVGLATNWLWPQVFFFFENFGRFTGHTNHKVPYFWFYLPVIAYGFFPWALFLPAALTAPLQDIWRRWRGNRTTGGSLSNAQVWFACSALATLLFFSASMTKLQTYVLPAWPAMAVLTGIMLDKWLTRNEAQPGRYLRTCAVIFCIIGGAASIAALVGVALANHPEQLPSFIHAHWAAKAAALVSDIDVRLRLSAAACLSIIGVGLLITWKRLYIAECRRGLQALFATAVVAGTIGGIAFYQLGYKYKNADVHRVVAAIKNKPGPVALFRDFKPSVVYHLQRPVDSFFAVDQLRVRTPSNDPHQTQYIIAGPKGASDLLAAYPDKLHVVSQSGGWYVFATDQLVALRLPTLKQSFTEHIDLSGGEYSWGTLPFAGGSKPFTQ